MIDQNKITGKSRYNYTKKKLLLVNYAKAIDQREIAKESVKYLLSEK